MLLLDKKGPYAKIIMGVFPEARSHGHKKMCPWRSTLKDMDGHIE